MQYQPAQTLSGPAIKLGHYVPTQVFEQLFQAYEQRLPKELADKAEAQGWLDPREVPADACPAERQLQLSYNQTPQVPGRRLVPSVLAVATLLRHSSRNGQTLRPIGTI
jgi:hypothetical protein